MKPFRFKPVRRAIKVDLPSFPSQTSETEAEQLTGSVQGKKASAPEERMAKALDKAGIQYIFRYVVGAPKGLPGWKELDFLVAANGVMNAIEVDTAFTHRNKANSDVLHDAIVLNDREIQSMGEIWPQVRHVDGDSDLASQKNADRFVKMHFSRSSGGAIGRSTEFETPQQQPIVQSASPVSDPVSEAPQITKKEPKQIVNKPIKQVVSTSIKAMDKKIERMDRKAR